MYEINNLVPKFHQHIKCATREENILDKMYTNIKQGYRAKPLAHLGQPDHTSLLLIPVHTPLRKRHFLYDPGALQDCFQCTNWNIFEQQDLEVYTAAVLGYIKFCMDNVNVDKHNGSTLTGSPG